jgi:hypothetical protein
MICEQGNKTDLNSIAMFQLRAVSVGFLAVPGMEPALQQRQCPGPEILHTTLVVQDTPCLARMSGCAWIQESGRDANRCAVSSI